MAAKEMYDYLSAVTADYTTTELDIDCHEALEEMGEKVQHEHVFSDGQRGIVTMSSNSFFTVNLTMKHLSLSDAGTVIDMYHDEDKANAKARSFYWVHPRDGHTYTVKFMNALPVSFSGQILNRSSLPTITLFVLGNKPA